MNRRYDIRSVIRITNKLTKFASEDNNFEMRYALNRGMFRGNLSAL